MSYATASDLLLWFGAKELAEVAVPDDRDPITADLLRLTIEGGQRDHFPSDAIETADLTQARMQAVLDEGGRVLDSYLARRYSLPLSELLVAATPLPRACCVLALTLLYDDLLPEAVEQRQHRILVWLQALASGKVELAGVEMNSSQVVGGPSYAAGARVFDEDRLRGFV